MDKRYQVFVSSTYTDLKEERQLVTKTLLSMNCIPAGMEMFPASDEAQFEFIKRVLNDCDYYLLILGGRYGTLITEGDISYTEREYDYAMEKGITVVAILHENPDSLPKDKTEPTIKAQRKLRTFRDRVSNGRMVSFWNDPKSLPGQVALGMINAINQFPSVGWIRADKAASEDVLNELRELQQKNDTLTGELASLRNEPKIEGLAPLEAKFTIVGSARRVHIWHPSGEKTLDNREPQRRETTWKEIFEVIAPFISNGLVEPKVRDALQDALNTETYASFNIDIHNFKTIQIQLEAHGLIEVKSRRDEHEVWTLTSKGKALMFQFRTVKVDK